MTDRIIFESSADQAGFTQMPNAVLMDERLTVQARFLYMLLRKFAWQGNACYPGQGRLAAIMGVTDRSVRTYLAELEDGFLVQRQSRGTARSCSYVLLALGLREHRIAGGATETQRRKPVSADAGSLLPAEEDTGKKTQQGVSARARGRVKVSGKPVFRDAWSLTDRILVEFNAQAGKKLRLLTSAGQPSEAAKRIYGRVVAYPDISFEQHQDIISRTLASRWWGGGSPSIGVVYGPKVFEDNITREAKVSARAAADDAKDVKKARAADDLAAIQRLINGASS